MTASKFTPENRAIILEALKANPSLPSAAAKADISPVTLQNWLRKGEEGNPDYEAFALEAAQARQTMKDEIVAALFETARDSLHPQSVKASQLLLMNLFPKEFASVKHLVSHTTAKADDQLDVSRLGTEELRQMRATLKKLSDDPNPHQPPSLDVIDVVATKKPSARRTN